MTSKSVYKVSLLLLGAQAVAGGSNFRRRGGRRRQATVSASRVELLEQKENEIERTCESLCIEQYDTEEFENYFKLAPEFDLEYCGVGYVIDQEKLQLKIDITTRGECREQCCIKQTPDMIRCAEHSLQPSNDERKLCYFENTDFIPEKLSEGYATECRQTFGDKDSCTILCCVEVYEEELCAIEVKRLAVGSVCEVYNRSVVSFFSDEPDRFSAFDLASALQVDADIVNTLQSEVAEQQIQDDKSCKTMNENMYSSASQLGVINATISRAKEKTSCQGNGTLSNDQAYRQIYDDEIERQKKMSEIRCLPDEVEMATDPCPVVNIESIKSLIKP